jgi:hypothetical protein
MLKAALIVLVALWPVIMDGQDSLAWGSDMNACRAERTRRDMKWDPLIILPSDSGALVRPIKTIEAAILLLGIKDHPQATEVALFDFLDSAAVELWKDGKATLLHGCHYIQHPVCTAADDAAGGGGP